MSSVAPAREDKSSAASPSGGVADRIFSLNLRQSGHQAKKENPKQFHDEISSKRLHHLAERT